MTRRRRIAMIPFVILAAACCLALGWWQWTRYESASGGFQNLGYALQWPLFAFFCVYAYRKFIRYEDSAEGTPAPDGQITEIPAGLLPERTLATAQSADAVLSEYNAYLAELAEKDKRTTA